MVRKRKRPAAEQAAERGEAHRFAAGSVTPGALALLTRPLAQVGGVADDENAEGTKNDLRPLPEFCLGLMALAVLLRSHLSVSHDVFFEAFAGSCRLTMGVMMSRVPCVMPFDTVYGEEFDVLANEEVLRNLIMLGMISFIWFGSPCRSMSFARWPPLRDTDNVRGFKNLKPTRLKL